VAKYQNKGKPPGSHVNGYAFFPTGEVAEFPPSVAPSRFWVPLDDEAVECMKKLKKALEDRAAKRAAAPAPRQAFEDVVTEIPSNEPDRSLVEQDDDERTLADLAPKGDARLTRGPVADDDRKTEDTALGTGGRQLTDPEPPLGVRKKPRESDKVI
jgi:hypothetical protein